MRTVRRRQVTRGAAGTIARLSDTGCVVEGPHYHDEWLMSSLSAAKLELLVVLTMAGPPLAAGVLSLWPPPRTHAQ